MSDDRPSTHQGRSRYVSAGWRALFALEIPICLATVLYWWLGTESYLKTTFGLDAADGVHVALVWQCAVVVGTVFVWFYGRWLLSPEVELRPFRWLQEGMAIGDVLLIVLGVRLLALPGAARAAAVAQIGMASLWLLVRVVFLFRTFDPPDRRASSDGVRFVGATAEERFWVRAVPWLFAPARGRPNALAWMWHRIVVTPLAHVTFFNVEYQIYLNKIFHTSTLAKISHWLCIPINVMLLFYGLAQFTLPGGHPVAHHPQPLMLNAGLLMLVVLLVWYVGVAVKLRSSLLGVLMVPWLTTLWMAGNTIYSLTFTLDAAARSWWLPTPWYLAPLFWMGIVSGVQAWSHLGEPLVPPRANGTRQWLRLRAYVLGPDSAPYQGFDRVRNGVKIFVGSLWGTVDEWWASMKLLPLITLEWLWRLGYHPEQRERFEALAASALESGKPALDFVGVGGDTYATELHDSE